MGSQIGNFSSAEWKNVQERQIYTGNLLSPISKDYTPDEKNVHPLGAIFSLKKLPNFERELGHWRDSIKFYY